MGERTIIFRGKRTDNGEWVEGYYACESNHACFAYELKYHHYIFKDVFLDWNLGGLEKYEVLPETIGQYTGLCDKNGNMIFEGDVVQFEDNNYVVRRECDTPGGYWAETGYILDHIGWNDYSHFTDTIDEGNNEICVEIIGNIHDNPELLKGGVQE